MDQQQQQQQQQSWPDRFLQLVRASLSDTDAHSDMDPQPPATAGRGRMPLLQSRALSNTSNTSSSHRSSHRSSTTSSNTSSDHQQALRLYDVHHVATSTARRAAEPPLPLPHGDRPKAAPSPPLALPVHPESPPAAAAGQPQPPALGLPPTTTPTTTTSSASTTTSTTTTSSSSLPHRPPAGPSAAAAPSTPAAPKPLQRVATPPLDWSWIQVRRRAAGSPAPTSSTTSAASAASAASTPLALSQAPTLAASTAPAAPARSPATLPAMPTPLNTAAPACPDDGRNAAWTGSDSDNSLEIISNPSAPTTPVLVHAPVVSPHMLASSILEVLRSSSTHDVFAAHAAAASGSSSSTADSFYAGALDASDMLLGMSIISTNASRPASSIHASQQPLSSSAAPSAPDQGPPSLLRDLNALGGMVGQPTPMSRTASHAAASEIFARGNHGLATLVSTASASGSAATGAGASGASWPESASDILASYVVMDRTSSRGSFRSVHSGYAGNSGLATTMGGFADQQLFDSPILVPLPIAQMLASNPGSAAEGPPPFALDRPAGMQRLAPASALSKSSDSHDDSDPVTKGKDRDASEAAATDTGLESPAMSSTGKKGKSGLDEIDDAFLQGFSLFWPTEIPRDMFGADDDSWSWILFKVVGVVLAAGVGGYVAVKCTSVVHRLVVERISRLILV